MVLVSPDDRVTSPYHFSLCLLTAVRRSSYCPMAFLILAFTSSLVMWSLYEIPRSMRKHLISNACILLSMSAVMVHDSHAYKNMDMARERISLILELMAMFLSFDMAFSLVIAAVVWAILDSTSGLDPLLHHVSPFPASCLPSVVDSKFDFWWVCVLSGLSITAFSAACLLGFSPVTLVSEPSRWWMVWANKWK